MPNSYILALLNKVRHSIYNLFSWYQLQMLVMMHYLWSSRLIPQDKAKRKNDCKILKMLNII